MATEEPDSKGTRRFWWLLASILVIDLIRHFLTFSLGPVSIDYDALEYWKMGQAVSHGDWLLKSMPIDYRTPGYAWWLGAFQTLLGKDALVGILFSQHVALIVTSWLTGYLAFSVSGHRNGFLFGYALSIACVTRCWYGNVLLTESLFSFWFILFLCIGWRYCQFPSWKTMVWMASVLALAILARPIPQLLSIPLLLGVCLLPWHPKLFTLPWSQRWAITAVHIALFIVIQGIFLGPWYYRNHLLFGEWRLTKLPAVNQWEVCFQEGAGPGLPYPKHPSTDRMLKILSSVDHPMDDRYCYAIEASLKKGGLSRKEIDDLIKEVCYQSILENPGRFAWAGMRRFINFFRCVVNRFPSYGALPPNYEDQNHWRSVSLASIYEPVLRNTLSRSVRWNEFFTVIVAIGWLRLFFRSRSKVFTLGMLLCILYFAAVTAAAEIENYRYRMILEPLFIVLLVGGWYPRNRCRQTENSASPSSLGGDRNERTSDRK